jgi:hypothetical protein
MKDKEEGDNVIYVDFSRKLDKVSINNEEPDYEPIPGFTQKKIEYSILKIMFNKQFAETTEEVTKYSILMNELMMVVGRFPWYDEVVKSYYEIGRSFPSLFFEKDWLSANLEKDSKLYAKFKDEFWDELVDAWMIRNVNSR